MRRLKCKDSSFSCWFKNSIVTDEVGNPLVVYRGEHGPVQNKIRANGHGSHKDLFQTRLGALSFGGASAASLYAMTPNRRDDLPISPRVTSALLSIQNPFMNRPDDPFVELEDIAKAIGKNYAIEIAIKMKEYIMNTCRWCDEIAKEFENFDEYFCSKAFNLEDLYFNAYALFDDSRSVEILKKAGFDGAIHSGTGETFGETEFKVFDTNQVWPLPCFGTLYEKLAR